MVWAASGSKTLFEIRIADPKLTTKTTVIDRTLMKTKTFAIIVAVLIGASLTISGTIMAFKGITQTGTIDIKSALVSGKIETGSLGLLFAFLGVILLITAVAKKREKKQH